MSAPNLEFVPQELLPQLAKIRPYVLLLLTKGANYGRPDTRRIIQSEHLPYTFQQRAEGILALTMPVNDDTRIAAIGIYAGRSKEEVKKLVEDDPAVKAGIFEYEIVNSMGLQGDVLP
ncbi:MAG TPA: YciI family protein [Puia sp.]